MPRSSGSFGPLTLPLVSLALAAGLACTPSAALAQVGTAITYQGVLANNNVSVNTATDMRFTLFDAPAAGNQVGNQVTLSGASAVAVNNGKFTASVDFGVNPYTADAARWLQIEVRNPAGVGNYVPMGARQRLTAAPFSAATRGINVNANGRAAILTQPFDDSATLTLGATGGPTPGASLRFRGDNNRLWDVAAFNGTGNNFGGFTIGRSGLDFPLVIDGVTSNILLNQNPTVGNVGIGTGTPTNKLTIGPGSGLFPLAGIRLLPSTDAVSERAAIDVDNWALVQDITGNGTKNFSIYDRSVDGHRLVVLPGGNVGIGTTVPATRLDVQGTARVSGRMSISGSAPIGQAGSGLWINGNDNGPLFPTGSAEAGIRIFNNSVAPGQSTIQGWNYSTNVARDIVINDAGGNVGIGTASPTFKLDVAGNIRCVALTQTSTRDFKQDITPLSGGLDAIMKLNPVSYSWNDQAPEPVRGNHDIGFIADEVNAVLPDIVAKDEQGKPIGIDYGKITPVAVEAIKQLKAENDSLKARLEKIEAMLAAQGSK